MIKNSSVINKVVSGTVSNYIGKFISLAILFFLTPFILHQLGDTTYGLWILTGSLVSYGALLDFGIWGAIIKFVADYHSRGKIEQAQQIVTSALYLYLILGLILILLSLLVAPIFPKVFNVPADQHETASRLFILMGVGAAFSLIGTAPLSVLRGLQRFDVVNIIEIIAALLTALATVGVLLLGGGVLEMVIVNIGGIFILLFLSLWFIRRVAPEMKFRFYGFDPQLARVVLSYSWPLFIKDIAYSLKVKTDEITIGAFLPVNTIAPYNLSKKLTDSINILTKQFSKVFLPLASELNAKKDLTRLRSVFIAGTRLTLAISTSLGCILIVLGRPILNVWVGSGYGRAGSIIFILTLATMLSTTQWFLEAILRGISRHRLLAATSIGSGVANLTLSILLIGPLGLTGVALGTLIPNAIEFAIVLPFTMSVLQVSARTTFKDIFLPTFIPAVVMLLALNVMRLVFESNNLLKIAFIAGTALVVYGVSYLSLGASEVERKTYSEIASRFFQIAKMQLKRLV